MEDNTKNDIKVANKLNKDTTNWKNKLFRRC